MTAAEEEEGWGCKCPCPQVNVPFYSAKLSFYFQTCPFVFQECLFSPEIVLLFFISAFLFLKNAVFQNCPLLCPKLLEFLIALKPLSMTFYVFIQVLVLIAWKMQSLSIHNDWNFKIFSRTSAHRPPELPSCIVHCLRQLGNKVSLHWPKKWHKFELIKPTLNFISTQ